MLTGYAGPGRGHVGVVSALVSDREIRLDHANWLGDGAIYIDDPVVDVSPENERIWYKALSAPAAPMIRNASPPSKQGSYPLIWNLYTWRVRALLSTRLGYSRQARIGPAHLKPEIDPPIALGTGG